MPRCLGLALLALVTLGRIAPAWALDPDRELTQYVERLWTRDDGLPPGAIRGLAQSPDGYLWIGTEEGLVRFDGVRFVAADTSRLPPPLRLRVARMSTGRDGTVWIATESHGALRLRDGRLERFTTEPAFDGIVDVEQSRSGAVWLATGDRGILRVEQGTTKVFDASTGLPSGFVPNLTAATDGSIYAGTSRGLVRLRHDRIELIDERSTGAAFARRDNTLWVSTPAGVARLENDRLVNVLATESRVRTLAEDRSDSLWVLTTTSGLVRRRRDGAVAVLASERLRSTGARGILEDREGSLWVAIDAGLLQLRDGPFVTVSTGEGLAGARVLALYEDEAGAVVAVTAGGGVDRVRGARAEPAPAAATAASSSLGLVHRDGAGRVWYGAAGGGLGVVDGARRFTFDARHGLHDETIGTILEDQDERLWLCSRLGVSVVPVAELVDVMAGRRERVSTTLFGRADGIRSPGCSAVGGARTRDGRLWFPTADGVAVVDPRGLDHDAPAPPVIIEAVRADDRALGLTGVVVAPGTRRLRIEFTAPGLATPARLRFQHRLVGWDSTWDAAAPDRVVVYSTLPPGSYRFEVGVPGGPLTALALTVSPALHETWWFRALVVAVALGLVALAVHLRTRRQRARARALEAQIEERTGELAQRNRDLETRSSELGQAMTALRAAESEIERTARLAALGMLARGVTHELENPIQDVAASVKTLEREAARLVATATSLSAAPPAAPVDVDGAEREVRAAMANLSEGARRAQLIIGDLQSMSGGGRAIVQLDLHRAVDQSVRLLAPRLVARRVDLALEEVPSIAARAGEIEQVIVNLLDNAVRAGRPDGTITIRTGRHGDAVRLAIKDDGAGMTAEVLAHAREPFFTTRAAGQGSGMGLAIVASVVKAHRGKLTIESTPGTGTEVIVELPVEGIQSGSSLGELSRQFAERSL